MHNKTVSKILVAIIMTSMLIAIIPTLPVGAVTLTGISPTSGNVDTEVTLVGSIDTQGGAYTIWFDIDDDAVYFEAGEDIETGMAPANSYAVSDTFDVPACLGSDAGNAHLVHLRDNQTLSSQSTPFAVITSRVLTASPTYAQEGDPIIFDITVTGGTTANQGNSFNVGVTDPDGTTTTGVISFTTDGTGSGSNGTEIYPTDFSTGASTDLTGTYMVSGNRTLPGVITDAVSTSFVIGLVNGSSFGRFEAVNVQTDGWANYQNVTITITDSLAAVAEEWEDQNLTTGMFSDDWVIPWDAPMGTYTVTAVNATGDNKAVDSIQTFTVGSADLDVAFTDEPMEDYQRTNTVEANFTITYPDATLFNETHFSSIVVNVYANDTLVDTVALTADDYDNETGNWAVSWKIPRDAALGDGYTLTLDIGDIADTNGNTGPTAAEESEEFTVEQALLTVMVTQEPAENYTRTEFAMAKINITYPDDTFFTDADLGEILVRVYRVDEGDENVANVTLVAGDFNTTTNEWTISWASPYNAALDDYYFQVTDMEVMDAANPNMGPDGDVTTETFELLTATINVDSINTDATSYAPGEYVRVFFDATYQDGTPVVTGSAEITLTAPDTYTEDDYNPVHTTAGRWQVTVWLSDAQAQVGVWNVTLAVNGLNDGAGNTGPATAVTTSFTVLPTDVTLEDIMAAIDALDDKIDAIEADTSALGSQLSTIYSAIGALEDVIDDIETKLDSLSATAATTTEVAAVSSAVSSLSSDLASLETKLTALQSAVANAATDSDVATVKAAVDEVSADIAALESSLTDLNTAINAVDAATPADVDSAVDTAVDAAVSDLSADIGSINTLVIIAIVLALIAAAAAIAAVYIIQRKIAG